LPSSGKSLPGIATIFVNNRSIKSVLKIVIFQKTIITNNLSFEQFNSPFCVQAKVIKLVGLKNGGRFSPTNLITFACTQNGEYSS
jgi:hypothetical protein